MSSELQKSCEYAEAKDVEILNTHFPESDNQNSANVKFTATIRVKLGGKLADDLKKYNTALAVYTEYEKEMQLLEADYKASLESIEKTQKAAREKFLAQKDERGYGTGNQQEHDLEMHEPFKKKEALKEDWIEKMNKVFEKYEPRATDWLYKNNSGDFKYFSVRSKPEAPLSCLGYYSAKEPLGILYRSVTNQKGSRDDYFAGVETGIEAERRMIKTKKGWMFAGGL